MWALAIPAAVAISGWFVVNLLGRRTAREQHRREATLQHLEQQLSDLYGPLTFLLLEGKRVFQDLEEDFGHDWRQGDRQLTAEEVRKWIYWSENYFIPRNERIQDLLSHRSHLIEGDRIPLSFLEFIDHHSSWTLEMKRWKETGVREGLYSRRHWPIRFADEVVATFNLLKRRHASLIGAETPRSIDDSSPLEEAAKPREPLKPRNDPWRKDP
jgi:hypothetical protein